MISNRVRCLTLILFIAALIISTPGISQQTIENNFNCFSIVVGKNASADGSVLFAHNEDDAGEQLVNYYRVPRIKHKQGETIKLATGAVISQVEETYGFLWFEMPKMYFSDSYMNEWGVVISSDACGSREDQPELTDGGIGYWLRRLVAERARTARDGVKIAGKFLSRLGYASSGRTYIIADANEGWMLAAVKGKHWVARRIPDDKLAVIPNYYTIGKVALADTVNFMASPDLIDYAIQRGWYDPKADSEFHFAKAYSSRRSLKHPGNIHRMWRGINLLANKKFDIDENFPFAIAPKNKVSVQELVKVLRDHYEGTELDKSGGYQQGSPYKMNRSTICARSTQYGFVAQLRHWMPIELGAVIWLAQHRPDSQALIPWYLGIQKIPAGYAYGNFESALESHFNPPADIYGRNEDHAFWTFVALAEQVDEDYGTRILQVRNRWDAIEKDAFKNQQAFEDKVIKIYKKDPAGAGKLLTTYTGNWAAKTWEMAKKMQD